MFDPVVTISCKGHHLQTLTLSQIGQIEMYAVLEAYASLKKLETFGVSVHADTPEELIAKFARHAEEIRYHQKGLAWAEELGKWIDEIKEAHRNQP